MAAFNGSTDALFGDNFFGDFTNGGDFLVGGPPEAVWPLSDGETGASSGSAALSPLLPPSHLPTPSSSPPTDADLLALFPELADLNGDCTAASRGEDVSGAGRLYSSLPASTTTFPCPAVAPGASYGPWENPETFSGEGVSGPGRLYPSPSPPTFPGPAFHPGANNYAEGPQDFWSAASSSVSAFPLEAPVPLYPLATSSPLAPSNASEGPSGGRPIWFNRSASTPAFPVASAPVIGEPPRCASAPDCLAAFAPTWEEPVDPAFAFAFGGAPAHPTTTDVWTAGLGLDYAPAPAMAFGGAPNPTTTTNVWTAGLGLDFAPAPAMAFGGPHHPTTTTDAWTAGFAPAPAIAFGGVPHPTTTTDVWTAGPGLDFAATPAMAFGGAPTLTTTTTDAWTAGFAPAPAITYGGGPPAFPNEDWTALLGAAPAPFPTTIAAPRSTKPPVRPAAAAAAAAPIATTSRPPPPTILLPSTTTTLLGTANAAARRKRRAPSTTDGAPAAKKKRGPGRRAKYADVTGFLVATVADAGALGHREGPTTMVQAPRSGRWRVNGEKVEKVEKGKGKRRRGGE